jgi:hypothetical protein
MPFSKAAFNEQAKITATWLNNLQPAPCSSVLSRPLAPS